MVTVEEFERFIALPENVDSRLELINGVITERGEPTQEHGVIMGNVGALIHMHMKTNQLGRGGFSINHRSLNDDFNELVPDYSFRLKPNQPPVSVGPVPQMPDFAAEVRSDDKLADMRAKAKIYLRLGTKLAWLILPRQRVVEVYWTNGDEEVYTVEDTLNFGDLLPGFGVAVRDIFDF